MKIKKKKSISKKTRAKEQKDRKNFIIILCVLLLANILIYFTAFPKLDDIAAAGSGPNSAEGGVFLKTTVIVLTDIILFVSLSMLLSRRTTGRKKR